MSECKVPNHLKEKIDSVVTMSEYKSIEEKIKHSNADYTLKELA